MSTIPQWTEPTLGLALSWGLDTTVRPNWFMVPYQEKKSILLQFGKGMNVHSHNRRIAEIESDGEDGQDAFFLIEGKQPGNTRIEVRDPKTNALLSTLAVTVKMDREIGISFNFCQDGQFNGTVRQPAIADTLITKLNEIYLHQTNIKFSLLKTAQLELKMIMGDIVREEPDIIDPKQKTGFARLGNSWEWDRIFAANADNGFNVYFVPSNIPADTNDTLIYTKGDNCVIEDGRQLVSYTLAHSIGRMLGADFTTDQNKRNHLMFWTDGVGNNFESRTDDFISRDDANLMNP